MKEQADRLLPPIAGRRKLRTVVLGAGIAGRLVVEELIRHPRLGYIPLGFLDDDARKQRRRILGLPVWGALRQLPRIARRHRIQLALLAIPSADGRLSRRLAMAASGCGVEFRIVPGIYEVLRRDTAAGTVRAATVEDFFRRPPVAFDLPALRQALSGKAVLVTGAAGSIGSQLARQVAAFAPRKLLLVDHEESNLYDTFLQLKSQWPLVEFNAFVANIQDRRRIRSILKAHRPSVIYHAAAYKHVPVMENNLLEAVKTNILGTSVLAEEAARAGVLRFVLISTDKAVSPVSVMGACKRFAELVVAAAAGKFPRTAFMSVRFGNVIRSRGNVFERFTEQIASGGPLTLTHPKMMRYFMTREEATQLVMQASAWGRGGETFVLDMGRQIKVVELARQMVRLAGLRMGSDIPVAWTGLRKGEKLREELMSPGERRHSKKRGRIWVFRSRPPSWARIEAALGALSRAAGAEDEAAGRRLLHRHVTDYGSAHA